MSFILLLSLWAAELGTWGLSRWSNLPEAQLTAPTPRITLMQLFLGLVWPYLTELCEALPRHLPACLYAGLWSEKSSGKKVRHYLSLSPLG